MWKPVPLPAPIPSTLPDALVLVPLTNPKSGPSLYFSLDEKNTSHFLFEFPSVRRRSVGRISPWYFPSPFDTGLCGIIYISFYPVCPRTWKLDAVAKWEMYENGPRSQQRSQIPTFGMVGEIKLKWDGAERGESRLGLFLDERWNLFTICFDEGSVNEKGSKVGFFTYLILAMRMRYVWIRDEASMN